MTEIKIQNGCWQKKARQKMCAWEETENLIAVPKLYGNAEHWRLGKVTWVA